MTLTHKISSIIYENHAFQKQKRQHLYYQETWVKSIHVFSNSHLITKNWVEFPIIYPQPSKYIICCYIYEPLCLQQELSILRTVPKSKLKKFFKEINSPKL